MCLPHASASHAVNLVMGWSWLKADLLALLLFWGYLCFPPPRQEGGEGRNESTLQPCQKLFLVAPGHPTHPGYGFIAMDLVGWRSWSEVAYRWAQASAITGMSRKNVSVEGASHL